MSWSTCQALARIAFREFRFQEKVAGIPRRFRGFVDLGHANVAGSFAGVGA